VIVPILAK